MSERLLKISGLNKSFFGVQVLRDVGFELTQGAVLGLVGENGSGKSTTMNILGGVLTRDSGRVELAGEDVAPSNSRDALALGIAFIHQELSLSESQCRREHLPRSFPKRMDGLPFIDRRTLRSRPRRRSTSSTCRSSPATPVMRLPQGERQLVEIAKALTRQARLIIFLRTDDVADGARDRAVVRDYRSAARAAHLDYLHQPYPRDVLQSL